MKTARQRRIVELLRGQHVRSQQELAALLADDGFVVTQGTLSRDLMDVGAVRVRSEDGELGYVIRGDEYVGQAQREARLAQVCADVLISAEASANLVILRTPPGAAQYLASMIDSATLPDVLGTIAGDDTIMVIARDPLGGPDVAARMLTMSGRNEQ